MVPFIGIVEAYVLAALCDAGLPHDRVRPTVDMLTREIGLEHALASHYLVTPESLDLMAACAGHADLSAPVADRLGRIGYSLHDGWAWELRLPIYKHAKVVVSPTVAFGRPIVLDSGAPVHDLVDRFLAGDSIAEVASDFEVPALAVEDVIRVATRAQN